MDQRKATDLRRAVKIGIIIGIIMALVTAGGVIYEDLQANATAAQVAQMEQDVKAGNFHRPHSGGAPAGHAGALSAGAHAANALTATPAPHAAPPAAPAAAHPAAPGKPTPPPAPATPAAPH
jgi:hypothetical protein